MKWIILYLTITILGFSGFFYFTEQGGCMEECTRPYTLYLYGSIAGCSVLVGLMGCLQQVMIRGD